MGIVVVSNFPVVDDNPLPRHFQLRTFVFQEVRWKYVVQFDGTVKRIKMQDSGNNIRSFVFDFITNGGNNL